VKKLRCQIRFLAGRDFWVAAPVPCVTETVACMGLAQHSYMVLLEGYKKWLKDYSAKYFLMGIVAMIIKVNIMLN
jgi:hypothetical protein